MKKNIILIVFALLLLGGCKKDKYVRINTITEKTPTVGVAVTSVSIRGDYRYPGDLKSVTVAYTQNSDYSSVSTILAENHNVYSADGYDYYYARLIDLEPGTTYYYYCIFDTGYGSTEGKQWSFTTHGTIAGHEYVDLCLPSGALWATCNVGADSPEDYGDYFAWGETTTKSTYDWSTYKWCNGSGSTLTKYNTKSSYGTVDNKTVLDLEDDAAHVNWGDGWRMPTRAELQELYNNTTRKWTTENGVRGYKFTSKTNSDKYIFLPAAGYYYDGSLYGAGSYGYYWSSSLYADYPDNAYYLYFYSGDVDVRNVRRYYGHSVRPVCPSRK